MLSTSIFQLLKDQETQQLHKGRVRPVVCLSSVLVSRLQYFTTMAAKSWPWQWKLELEGGVDVEVTLRMAYGGYGIAQLTVAVRLSL